MQLVVTNNHLNKYDSAFARVMQELNINAAPALVTALSGGSDSSALACLADRYAKSHGKTHHAVIVNHNIRKDA